MTDTEAEMLEEAIRNFRYGDDTFVEFIKKQHWWTMPLEERIGRLAYWVRVRNENDKPAKLIRYAYVSLCTGRKPVLNIDNDESGHHEQAKSLLIVS